MALYGDLITAIPDTLFLPSFYIRNFDQSTVNGTEALILCLMVGSCCMHWAAWARTNCTLSILAFVVKLCCIAMNHIFNWPYDDQAILVPQLIWMLFIHIGGNYMHDKSVKVGKTVFAFAFVALSAVLAENVDTVSTLLKGSLVTVMALFLHLRVWLLATLKDERGCARAARIVLGVIYAHYLTCEIISITQQNGYMATGCINLLKIGILASISIIATGAFEDQVSMKDALQRLLISNGNELADQAEVMQMTSMALEASETAIAITDSENTILWSNLALCNLIGLVSGEPSKRCLVDAMKLTGDSRRAFRSFFDSGQKCMELAIEEKDLRIIVIPFTMSSRSRGFPNLRYLVSLMDITQTKARERAEKIAEQAELQRAAKRESMETLTHELRTPLQGIIGMTSLVVDSSHVSLEEMQQCVNTVMASSRLLLTLINNLLDSHKIAANMMSEFQLLPMSLADAMRDAANFCRPIAALNDTNTILHLDFGGSDDVCVSSNPVRFQQILVNLVSNAIKYASKGAITLRAEVCSIDDVNRRIHGALATGLDPTCTRITSKSMVAVVSVEDCGEGIPSDLSDRIFQKFAQYDGPDRSYSRSGSPKAFASGTGIGLDLCRQFVEKMHGNIWVNNMSDGGAVFSIYLPLEDASCVKPVQSRSKKQASGFSQRMASRTLSYGGQTPVSVNRPRVTKILLVDDTAINLKVLERMIRKLSDMYHVKTANSGEKALLELVNEAYDLVITDIQMPCMDGIALCRAIRETSLIKQKPVVVALTAETSESLHRRCSAVGISEILYKPISSHQIKLFFENTVHTLKPCGVSSARSLAGTK